MIINKIMIRTPPPVGTKITTYLVTPSSPGLGVPEKLLEVVVSRYKSIFPYKIKQTTETR